jgi:putative hydrolase of the HAD superfamily
MAPITALFWDVGGVLLTDGWDVQMREQAARTFGLDLSELERRHAPVFRDLEAGRSTLDDYLDQVIFHRPRSFTREQFREFMFQCSQPHPEVLALAQEVARSGRYFMATLNNESLELNLYRIQHFDLAQMFTVFFSSGFLGLVKPDPAIFRRVLQMTQRPPEQCVFIDDRSPNVEAARRSGMQAVHYQGPSQLREALKRLGIDAI